MTAPTEKPALTNNDRHRWGWALISVSAVTIVLAGLADGDPRRTVLLLAGEAFLVGLALVVVSLLKVER